MHSVYTTLDKKGRSICSAINGIVVTETHFYNSIAYFYQLLLTLSNYQYYNPKTACNYLYKPELA